MKIISVNVGLPRAIEHNGEIVTTGIYKTPIAGTVRVNADNLAGDAQADLRYHGGWSKAVYAYGSEHYEFWRGELGIDDLQFGAFGENLTTEGLLEHRICAGDHLRVGTAEFVATEPRFPCFKLGVKFGRKDIIKKFQKSRRSGIYFAIIKTGEIAAGDRIEFISRDANQVSISDLSDLHDKKNNLELARRALAVEALPEKWKRDLRKMLEKQ